MVAEPQRSQYLEAMGLTAWVGRYRLPNAAPTPACEWLEPEAPPSQAPAQRLHALLDETPAASAPTPPAPATPARQSKRARQLLEPEGGITAEPAVAPATVDEPTGAPASSPRQTQEALRFTLQIAALDGRWLVLLPGTQEPDETTRRLLASLLQAAGIVPAAAPDFQAFRWPMMEGLPVDAPLDEARDGLRAFVAGRRKRGWRPERLLMFGESEVLAPVLEMDEGRCRLLEIAGWQGPSLQELAQSAAAKRALWPTLVEWRQAWHRAADGGAGEDTSEGDNDAVS